MTFTWTFDAPTGTYKSHAMSTKVWEAAVENSVFVDHVQPIPGFGRKMGETVTLTRVRNVTEPDSADLDETIRIPEDDFSLSTTLITVKELGRAIPYTNLSLDLSEYDLENPIQKKLREQMRLVLDSKAATAFKSTQVKYIPTGASAGTFNTDGTFAEVIGSNMNVFHVEQIRDFMFDDLQVPPLEGGDYLGIFRTLGLRGIKDDSAWEQWHIYTDPQVKFNGEVGRIESVRFMETNHAKALSKLGATSQLGEGVVFGEDSVGMAEAMTPELRAAIPADFGRQKSVAWYGILEFGIIWDTGNAGEAKIVHVTGSNA